MNGVRGLMLDMYDFHNGIWLCHSFGGICFNNTAFLKMCIRFVVVTDKSKGNVIKIRRSMVIFKTFWDFQVGRIQVIAFQSLDGKHNHMLRALPLALTKRSAVIDLESSLSSSENALTRTESLEQDTGDSRATAGAFKV
ncbi:unnamed protein product [Camellia sinensis]